MVACVLLMRFVADLLNFVVVSDRILVFVFLWLKTRTRCVADPSNGKPALCHGVEGAVLCATACIVLLYDRRAENSQRLLLLLMAQYIRLPGNFLAVGMAVVRVVMVSS